MRSIVPVLCLSLAACSTTPQFVTHVPPPPANLSSPCEMPEPLPPPATMGDLLRAGINNADLLAECARKQRGLVAAWPRSCAGNDCNKP